MTPFRAVDPEIQLKLRRLQPDPLRETLHSFGLRRLRFRRFREATSEQSLIRWWRSDWRHEQSPPSAELVHAIPVAEQMLTEYPEEFEADTLLVSGQDVFAMRQYSSNASAVLLARSEERRVGKECV